MIVAVTGLVREARIVRGERVVTLTGGGDADGLKKQLDTVLPEKGVSGVISIGVAGGLSPDLRPGHIVIGSEVVSGEERYETDSDWMQRLWRAIPRSKPGAVAGSDVVIMHRPDKTELYERTGAFAVDMESHIAARAAYRHQKPFAVLRVICDPADRTLPPAALVAMKPDGSVDTDAVLRSVMAHPQQILSLIYLMKDSATAFRALLRCRDFLGDGLAGPDLR
jgi:hopanoid-associated phosphorylase